MKWLTKPISINPLFFTFFLFLKQSLSSDPDYEACVPNRCSVNGPNISYPFFIYGLQNSTCGYPGLELHCRNGSPILRISENDFWVLHIDYDNRNLRLQSTAILPDQTLSCSSNVRNLTLDPNRFRLNNLTTTNLVFISNCLNNTNTKTLDRYRIRSCEKSAELVMLANDTNLRTATEICGSGSGTVTTLVELGGGEGVVDGGNYTEVMRRGFVLSWLAADCGACRKSGGRCGFNTTAFQFRCFCPDRPHMVSCKPEPTNHTPIIIAVVCGSVFALLAVFIAAVFMIRRGYKRKAFAYFSSKDKSRDLEDASVFGVPVFSYAELQDATHNFDPSQELGDGGFGTVYYGKLRDGREVAVKRLYEHNYKRVQQFMNEVDILTRLRHKHLVSLYGCTSRRSRELLLVYEYISNGTVADHLHGELVKTIPLTWPIRMKIAVETASALVYLHASEIIHRDVKTNNILLDHNFCVKVADFGLSRLLPNDMTHVSTAPQGTPGYVDPEYHQCYQLTDKSDVYSFGVVLIELISSMPAIDISRSREEISLANMAINRIQKCALDELIDPFLRSNSDTERMTRLVAELAFRCLQFDSDSRPTMIEVLEVLKGIQGDDIENLGELKSCTKPPASPEIEDVGLLKGQITASPISVTAKWHSTSSGLNTPNTSSV